MVRSRCILPNLLLVTRKLHLVTVVLVVAFLLAQKANCRPHIPDFVIAGSPEAGAWLKEGHHPPPKLRALKREDVQKLNNPLILFDKGEERSIKGPLFAQQLRSNIVTADEFRQVDVAPEAMKDRDAFATALGIGKDPSDRYYLANLLQNFYHWRKVKGLESWKEDIIIRVKQDLGQRKPEDIMLLDFLDAVFHHGDQHHSVSEERFLKWLSRRYLRKDVDKQFLKVERYHGFYHLEDLIQNYIKWARLEDEEHIPNAAWIMTTLEEKGEVLSERMMKIARQKGMLQYGRGKRPSETDDTKWWSDYHSREPPQEVMEDLIELRKMPNYNAEAVEKWFKSKGFNFDSKYFTRLNPDGTPAASGHDPFWSQKADNHQGSSAGHNTKASSGQKSNSDPSRPQYDSMGYLEPTKELKESLEELRKMDGYDPEQTRRDMQEMGLNINPMYFTPLKPDGEPAASAKKPFWDEKVKKDEQFSGGHSSKPFYGQKYKPNTFGTNPNTEEFIEPDEAIKKSLESLRKISTYDPEGTRSALKAQGFNIHPKYFTRLNPDGTEKLPGQAFSPSKKGNEGSKIGPENIKSGNKYMKTPPTSHVHDESYKNVPKLLRPIKRFLDGLKRSFQSLIARIHSILGIRPKH